MILRRVRAAPRRRFDRVLALAFLLALTIVGGASARADGAGQLRILFAGDVMLDDGPGRVARAGHDPFAAFASILAAADFRVANLECVVATAGRAEPDKPWTFRARPASLAFVKRHFDAVSLANNHSMDFGDQAFNQMLGLLRARGLPYFGGGRDLVEAHRPLIVERNGLRVALLGYNEFFPRSFEADVDQPGVAWSEDEQVVHDITLARSLYRADLVIPFMHWGIELEPLADERQRRLARRMIDAGADAVVGGHPHIVQDIDQYRGRPIFYSLGNFVFDGFSDPTHNTGWVLRLDLDRSGVRAWRIHVARIDARGIPRPAQASEDRCWARGQADPGVCR